MRIRKIKQLIAVVLVASMVCSNLPYSMLAVHAEETDDICVDETEIEGTIDELDETGTVIESENTENSTTFDLGGGKRKTVFFSSNVRFEDENGELQEYDPSLKVITEETSKMEKTWMVMHLKMKQEIQNSIFRELSPGTHQY